VNGLVTNAAATGYVQTKTGTLGLNGYSAGGYWTHYGPTGWYLDLVLQGTYYNGNAITQFANLPINGSGFISSLEGGGSCGVEAGTLGSSIGEMWTHKVTQKRAFRRNIDGSLEMRICG
jgi:outer membrane autotransporter protein